MYDTMNYNITQKLAVFKCLEGLQEGLLQCHLHHIIISTKQTSIYISTFPNALTSKKAQNHEISICFSTNSIVVLCHATSITLKFKMLRFPNEAR